MKRLCYSFDSIISNCISFRRGGMRTPPVPTRFAGSVKRFQSLFFCFFLVLVLCASRRRDAASLSKRTPIIIIPSSRNVDRVTFRRFFLSLSLSLSLSLFSSGSHRVLPQVRLSFFFWNFFTEFYWVYWVLLDLNRFLLFLVLLVFYLFLLGLTRFDLVFPSFTGF